jgi:hypothetical protein
MNRLYKHGAAVLLALSAATHGAVATAAQDDRPNQDQVVQDGIAVKPLKRNSIGGVWRDIAAPEEAINQQSAQQYLALMSKAKQEGALVPESDPRAGIALWNKMAALNQSGAPIELLSTHPGGGERIEQIENHMNVLLPLYARSKGTSVDRLPPYRSNVALR